MITPTINDLPQELLCRIIELGCELSGPQADFWRTREHLLAKALVGRRWTVAAQRFLWRVVLIRGRAEAKACSESPVVGRFRTVHVCFVGGEAENVRPVLEKLEGVRMLSIHAVEGDLKGTILELPNLRRK
jgi:hypothetical protein